MNSITVKSPAKINLYLKVIGRRPDGYHKLVTLFARIALADTLTLKKRKEGIALSCKVTGMKQKLSSGEDNLIVKAYRLLQKKFPEVGGVSVKLEKKIPMGAGLGGGSGNAAAFLAAMKKLYHLPLSQKESLKLGSKLGADVAFFLTGSAYAIGRGTGAELEPLQSKTRHKLLLIASDKGLSTAQVYRALPKKLPLVSLAETNRSVKLVFQLLEKKQYAKAASLLENDLEAPAFRLRPSLQKQLRGLHQKGLRAARMTGSGPSLFALLPDARTAKGLARRLRGEFPKSRIFLTSTG